MKKISIAFLAMATFLLMTFSSCQKAAVPVAPGNTQTSQYNGPKQASSWYLYLLGAAVIVAVVAKLGQGQATNVQIKETKNPDGSVTKTTTYNCSGVGSCHVSMAALSTGQPLDGNLIEAEGYDYNLNMKLAKSESGDILLGLDPAENDPENVSKIFYAPEVDFLSPGQTYTIDNAEVLSTLGLTDPLVINAGNYKVYETPDGDLYMIIGHTDTE